MKILAHLGNSILFRVKLLFLYLTVLRLLFVLATEHTMLRMFLIFGAKFCFRETCMMMRFRISVQLNVEQLTTRSATPITLGQLPVYFYLSTGRIQLDCFARSV